MRGRRETGFRGGPAFGWRVVRILASLLSREQSFKFMSKHLDPIILKQLRAFARRRRSLILVRGVLATLAMLVGAMVAVAAVDFWVPFIGGGDCVALLFGSVVACT